MTEGYIFCMAYLYQASTCRNLAAAIDAYDHIHHKTRKQQSNYMACKLQVQSTSRLPSDVSGLLLMIGV